MEQVTKTSLTKSELQSGVLRLAVPAIGEQLLFTVTQVTALVMVGHLGAEAIAAVGVGNQISWFFSSGFYAFSAGTTTLVARYVGAGERPRAQVALTQAVAFVMLMALVVAGAGIAITPLILRLMGAEGEVLALGVPFLRLLMASQLFSSVNMCLGAALRGAGDTKTPFKVSAAGAVLNVAIIWLLVYGRFGLPALGVPGAGLAVVVAQIVVLFVYLATYMRGKAVLHLSFKRFRPEIDTIRRLLFVGVPAALEQLFMSGGMTVFARIVITLGTEAYAAHQITANITNASYMTGFGFSLAATTLVGQCLGAKRPEDADAYALSARRLGFFAMSALCVVFFFFGAFLVGFYSDDPAIVSMGAMALKLAAFAQPAIGTYAILAGALRGAGDTRYPLYITFVGVWCVRITIAWVLITVFPLGLNGIWIAVLFDSWTRTLLVWLRFRTGRWKTISI
jgi:putative MATE family efflux protein